MTDERILEVVENQDKYYILGFISGIKADRDILKQENKDLKKQLQIKAEGFKTVNEELCEYAEENEKLKTQQQEFIEYLKEEIKDLEHSRYDSFNKFGEYKLMFYKDILQKYKERLGVSDK